MFYTESINEVRQQKPDILNLLHKEHMKRERKEINHKHPHKPEKLLPIVPHSCVVFVVDNRKINDKTTDDC